ncbi:unnamed protein product [Mycena citricolor]|uniref:Uncharacterized protein n=1 Tax=Mycena citricolor TaxID=2018698 RepID=A0AAD2HGZ4_9AGAR|nr:unnamed protein product [Mycena citricolor]
MRQSANCDHRMANCDTLPFTISETCDLGRRGRDLDPRLPQRHHALTECGARAVIQLVLPSARRSSQKDRNRCPKRLRETRSFEITASFGTDYLVLRDLWPSPDYNPDMTDSLWTRTSAGPLHAVAALFCSIASRVRRWSVRTDATSGPPQSSAFIASCIVHRSSFIVHRSTHRASFNRASS